MLGRPAHLPKLVTLVALGILPMAVGCGHCGPRSVTRRYFGCNLYGTPAYVKDRIDVRPPKAHRVATYRWAHARGPLYPPGIARCSEWPATDSVAVAADASSATPPAPAPPDASVNAPVPLPDPLELGQQPSAPIVRAGFPAGRDADPTTDPRRSASR